MIMGFRVLLWFGYLKRSDFQGLALRLVWGLGLVSSETYSFGALPFGFRSLPSWKGQGVAGAGDVAPDISCVSECGVSGGSEELTQIRFCGSRVQRAGLRLSMFVLRLIFFGFSGCNHARAAVPVTGQLAGPRV